MSNLLTADKTTYTVYPPKPGLTGMYGCCVLDTLWSFKRKVAPKIAPLGQNVYTPEWHLFHFLLSLLHQEKMQAWACFQNV